MDRVVQAKGKMMRPRCQWAGIAVALILIGGRAESKTVNVFFAGGQSNAKAVWATAIADGLKAGYGSSLVMAHTNHSGEGLANWFTDTSKINYSNDLFHLNGTSVLQTRMAEIAAAGDEPVFRGFFWFQGETDTGSYASIDAYTNRFRAMMAQLKQDLALTQEVAFCLAIIDANPDPYYDDPANAGGRTRAMIGALRTNQTDLCSGPSGSYVDTRGYTRTDMWHLTTTELTRLGAAMSVAFTNAFGISLPPEETVTLVSHDNDGSVYPNGVFPTQDLICGNAGNVQYNGILFFPLPAHAITAADLANRCRTTAHRRRRTSISGDWAINPFRSWIKIGFAWRIRMSAICSIRKTSPLRRSPTM